MSTASTTRFGPDASRLQRELTKLQLRHHSHCLFRKTPPVPGLKFRFQPDNTLRGDAVFEHSHQGYDGMVHGGLIAGIIDASMTQCLMGHGIVAFTTELSVRYRAPVDVGLPTVFETAITDRRRERVFTLQCSVRQGTRTIVNATGRFFKKAEASPVPAAR